MHAIPPLLEREPELAALAALTAAVAGSEPHGSDAGGAGGRGRVVLIEGHRGLGRTALLRRLAGLASDRGLRVLTAGAARAETAFAFGVVNQLFEPLLGDATDDTVIPANAGISTPTAADPATDLVRAALVLGTDSPGVSPDVVHALYRLTARFARRTPLALLVDDLQWCDAASARFLGYLARRADRLPMLLAVTLGNAPGRAESEAFGPDAAGSDAARPEAAEPTHGTPDWLDDLRPEAMRLRLRPLSRPAVARFIRPSAPSGLPEAAIDAVHRSTGGNPALLAEAARTAQPDDGVDAGRRLASAITRLRLARFGPADVTTAQALAVLGGSDDPAALAALGELPEPAAESALDRLIEAGMVTGGPSFALVHPLITDAVAGGIAPARRMAMHRRAAEYLLRTGRPAEDVAAHLLVLPPRGHPDTIAVLGQAAEAARRRGAIDRVVDYLRRAVAESSTDVRRAELLAALGGAEALTNDIPGALTHLGQAFDTETDALRRASIAGPLARIALFAGSADDALRVLRGATAGLSAGPLRTGLAALRAYAASIAGVDDAQHLPSPPASCADVGDCLLATASAWRAAMHGGAAGPAAELAARALADGSLIASDWAYMAMVAATVLVLADREETADAWAAAERALSDPESRLSSEGILVWQSWVLLERGHPRDALAAARRYFEHLDRQPDAIRSAGADYGHGILLRALVELDALDEARTVSRTAQARRVGSDGDLHRRRGLIELLLAEHRYDEAEAALARLHQLRPAIRNPVWLPVSLLRVRTLIGLGRPTAAADAAHAGLAEAQRWGTRSAVGLAQRALGEALDAAGDDGCLDVLEHAATLLERAARPLEWARTAVSWGSALRRRGQLIEARALLAKAAGLADERGCRRLAERALSELRAAGGRRASALRTGLAALTERELAVSRLAASGLTNRQIAVELHVGAKTVETHLSSVYRKLQIAGRAQLPPPARTDHPTPDTRADARPQPPRPGARDHHITALGP